MCDLFIISGGFSRERSDLFMHQHGMWHLLTLDRAAICFSLKRKTSENILVLGTDCLPNLTPGVARASGALRMVVFMEPCSFAAADSAAAWQLGCPHCQSPAVPVPVEWRR